MPVNKKFNKNFFKKWSKNMAYILGFLFADGNIIKTKRGTHFVGWYSSDQDLLVSMTQSMDSDHKISKRRGGYALQIGSKELFYDLVKLGLTPNKTRRMRLPKIPQKYERHFVRGYFDGDGNVWSGLIHKKRKKQTKVLQVCFTSASHEFLKGLLLLLKDLKITGGSLYRSKKGSYSRLLLSTLDALKLFKIMYNETHGLFLARKKAVFESFIEMRP